MDEFIRSLSLLLCFDLQSDIRNYESKSIYYAHPIMVSTILSSEMMAVTLLNHIRSILETTEITRIRELM
jgi:hypothetical protein